MTTEATPEDPALALLGSVVAGRYRVDRLLGTGGMGAVYLAEHVLMHKTVALKVLHREMTMHPEIVARFEREAVAAARIDHPNVAAAMDFGRLEDGSCYLVLEYVNGQSLRDLVAEGPLDPSRALVVARQIGGALAAAHSAGIVHRDLKPDNVMLVPQPDGSDLVKVLDFGIAKLDGSGDAAGGAGRQLTRIGTVIGTAGYMAPEQALGQTVDHRADLYAFGVVLYEMLAGRIPFNAEEVTQILAKQLTERPAPLPEGTPPDLAALTGKLLEKSADDRIQTTAEVVDWLDRAGVTPGGISPPGEASASVPVTAVVAPAATARTVLDTDAGAGAGPLRRGVASVAEAPAGRRSFGVAVALLLLLVGVFLLWKARGSGSAAASASPSASASGVAAAGPSAKVAASAATSAPSAEARAPAEVAPATSGATPVAAAKPATDVHETVTETKTTTQAGGRTTRTTRRTTVREQKTETRTKRRTGPGGIYIPPPSQWFK